MFQKYSENCLQFCGNWPVKFAIFLKSSLLFSIFYCLFLFVNEIVLYDSITSKLGQIWMRKLQCLLFVLKWSRICNYIISMTVPLIVNISISNYCKLWLWILKEPPFAKRASNIELWSWQRILKGTLKQIWKSGKILVFIWK